jgi:hypothetical protein
MVSGAAEVVPVVAGMVAVVSVAAITTGMATAVGSGVTAIVDDASEVMPASAGELGALVASSVAAFMVVLPCLDDLPTLSASECRVAVALSASEFGERDGVRVSLADASRRESRSERVGWSVRGEASRRSGGAGRDAGALTSTNAAKLLGCDRPSGSEKRGGSARTGAFAVVSGATLNTTDLG